mmetsp:Transcript_20883/g.30051  ORF Transcript_20883/g.30051 Transcript_20883/m.30051 type:complete len:524 (-) Transcript_20883:94-1665(-)
MDTNIGLFRTWFDERDVGTINSSCPLQTALVCNAIYMDTKYQDVIDNEVLSIASQPIKIKPDPSSTDIRIDSDAVVASVLQDISVDCHMLDEQHYPSSISELFQFSADLEIMLDKNSAEQRNSVKQTVDTVHTTANPSPAAPLNKVTSKPSNSQPPSRPNPFKSAKEQFREEGGVLKPTNNSGLATNKSSQAMKRPRGGTDNGSGDVILSEGLQHFEKHLIDRLEAEILQENRPGSQVTFKDIAGLDFAKKCVQELICWPMLRPDIFTGLRSLPKGLLLFGPPGTGKTLIGKAIAHQAGATFFSISASSLTSKWVGESESAVRALFALAVVHQPSVVFIDEVDSLLTQRSSDESEASRRIKTEFLVQLDGAGTSTDARVVVIGATNRPDELDDAARRRFVKRLYIPLPDEEGRRQLLHRLLLEDGSRVHTNMGPVDIDLIVGRTKGFSGADVRSLCTEAAMGPVREIASSNVELHRIVAADVPPVSARHFEEALDVVSPSVSVKDLEKYIRWNTEFGTYRRME